MNKLNIKEANKHLKQLHRRVIELENQVHMHALHSQELEKTNAELRARLEAAELSRQRELEVYTLSRIVWNTTALQQFRTVEPQIKTTK